MQASGSRIFLRTAFIQHLNVCDPGALPDARDTDMKENACPWEVYSLGVALQIPLVYPLLVYPR